MGRLPIGLLGCGTIAQYAHIPALARCSNVKLVSLCDTDEKLLRRASEITGVPRTHIDHGELFNDPKIEAVLIAVPDAFHKSLAIEALIAGKHVLIEKPLAETSNECREIAKVVEESGLILQVGNMKRHYPGIYDAHVFARQEMGELLSVSSWYRDSLFRTIMQKAVVNPPHSSTAAKKPKVDPKTNIQRYSLVTHGAHIFDMLRYLAGEVRAVTATVASKFGQFSWHGLLEFENGGRGHFEISVKVNADIAEGYIVHGEKGSVEVEFGLPFYIRPAKIKIFKAEQQKWMQPLGAFSNPYAKQLDDFAETIRYQREPVPDVQDGLAAILIIEAVKASVADNSQRVVVEPLV